MSLDQARAVADAVLYEGYLLYPYRATSAKNRIRWQFGVLGPPGASADGLGEESGMHAECLVRARDDAELTVHLRFLQLQVRQVEQADDADPSSFRVVDRLVLGDTDLMGWDEAVEGSGAMGPFCLSALAAGMRIGVEIAGGEETEAVRGPDGHWAGRVTRRRWPLKAAVRLGVTPVDGRGGALRLEVDVENVADRRVTDKDDATRVSLLGAHLLMQLSGADFVSLLEPPGELAPAAAGCRNQRCWPVLIGAEGATDTVLVSPIILYDYPALAPESAGALFDSTEIDEILTLRVLTLTDEEKAAARATDPAAAAIIDRCEQMSPEAMQQLHGVLRHPHLPPGHSGRAGPERPGVPAPTTPGLLEAFDAIPTFTTPGDDTGPAASGTPWWDPGVDASVSPMTDTVVVGGVKVGKGSRVRLRPQRRADAQDLFFADQIATVTAVFFDVDGATHVAVVLVDDPAADLHESSGRYLYFAPEEIEPLEAADPLGETRTVDLSQQIRPHQIRPHQIRPHQIRPQQIRPQQIRPQEIRPQEIKEEQQS